jgi:hypothetical protein
MGFTTPWMPASKGPVFLSGLTKDRWILLGRRAVEIRRSSSRPFSSCRLLHPAFEAGVSAVFVFFMRQASMTAVRAIAMVVIGICLGVALTLARQADNAVQGHRASPEAGMEASCEPDPIEQFVCRWVRQQR